MKAGWQRQAESLPMVSRVKVDRVPGLTSRTHFCRAVVIDLNKFGDLGQDFYDMPAVLRHSLS
jgi:hypothetical protein